MAKARNSQKGVTLVETLVALAVMGLIIGALLVLMGQNSRFAASMRERTMASIAADNLMVEALVLRDAVEIGETEGEVTVGGETYRYRRAIIETGVENIVRVEIDVLSPTANQRLGHAVSMRRTS
ncbi:type II secretion system minor pseudopilin GspI [Hyphococcus sp.]|jgi:general secretion pathway protein I|uniref:type II secretion system minor pseudopilin GspI n=1 Tax=Hyphococcus sp. TaxID=2038636 RepID=UPI003D117F1F